MSLFYSVSALFRPFSDVSVIFLSVRSMYTTYVSLFDRLLITYKKHWFRLKCQFYAL